MRSFTKVASFLAVAVAALAILAPSSVQAQEGVTHYDKRSKAANPFKVPGYNPLMMLAEGPYPSADAGLEKRAIGTCDPGYSVCTAAGGYCCPTGSRCSPESRLCCDNKAPYICGFGTKCCPYNSCTVGGGCGCPVGQTKCGTDCCSNGCDKTGQYCACEPDMPVDCGGIYCCSRGASCSAGSTCSSTTTTSRSGTFPTNVAIGGGRSAGSVHQASAPFAAVMAAAAIVFGA
ncbi:hypothetical protein BG015_011461 [Linnemannia schmuckeri]|uniref:Uncharacterized protein n=1 Tax=Linnemannia schmuckeri TaxID=64567 RepID=A0A9P5S4W1_9FUNG|nr:hypothetical protein BG015_011461 [Linnemannia schmuckeri]